MKEPFRSRLKALKGSSSHQPQPLKEYTANGEQVPLKRDWTDVWCSLPCGFDAELPKLLDYQVRADDVFVVTFIKCGTTWMQEIAWLLLHRLDYRRSQQISLTERSPFIDFNGSVPKGFNFLEHSLSLKSPRLLKTHLPAHLLPRQLWQQSSKIIYVARNCKDVIVSAYHFLSKTGMWLGHGLADFVDDFLNNEVMYTHFWTHVVDFWRMRHQPFVCFVTYEAMKSDCAAVIRRLCTFLERPQLTELEMQELLNHVSFDCMRSNRQVNLTYALKEITPTIPKDFQFMRRGVVGSFKDELTPELCQKIDKWSQAYLAQYGLKEEDIFGVIG